MAPLSAPYSKYIHSAYCNIFLFSEQDLLPPSPHAAGYHNIGVGLHISIDHMSFLPCKLAFYPFFVEKGCFVSFCVNCIYFFHQIHILIHMYTCVSFDLLSASYGKIALVILAFLPLYDVHVRLHN